MFRLTQSFISGFLICMASPLLFVSALSRASSCWKHLHRPLQALLQLHFINPRHAKEASVNSLQNGKYLFSTFSQPQLDGSGSVLCFSKHLHHFVAWKTARKIFCFRAAEVGAIFSTDAPFAKSILLHVFTSVALHVAMYITTKYRSNRAISSSYISLFCCTDASFTNTFVTSEKDYYAS